MFHMECNMGKCTSDAPHEPAMLCIVGNMGSFHQETLCCSSWRLSHPPTLLRSTSRVRARRMKCSSREAGPQGMKLLRLALICASSIRYCLTSFLSSCKMSVAPPARLCCIKQCLPYLGYMQPTRPPHIPRFLANSAWQALWKQSASDFNWYLKLMSPPSISTGVHRPQQLERPERGTAEVWNNPWSCQAGRQSLNWQRLLDVCSWRCGRFLLHLGC